MRKRCIRRRYHAELHPVRLAQLADKSPTEADLSNLLFAELLSVAAWEAGIASDADMRTLRMACEASAALARMGVGPEVMHLQMVPDALAVLRRGTAPPDPVSAEVVSSLLALYDGQRRMASVAQFERAAHLVAWGKPR